MKTRVILALGRIPTLVALAIVLIALVSQSSLLHIVPGPTLPIAISAIALALLAPLLAPRSPLPGALAVTVPVLALASYDQSRLDWLRLLKDFGVSEPSAPNWLRLALAILALLLAWAAHAVDNALRLGRSATSRGMPLGQARKASLVSATRTIRVAVLALLGTILIGGGAFLVQDANVGALFGGQASLFAPLLAVGLIALAAVLVAGGRASRE